MQNLEDVVKNLEALAKCKVPNDSPDDFDAERGHCSEVSIEETYQMGIRHGKTYLAREILNLIGLEHRSQSG